MARYHINGKGEPGLCRAQHSCPFGTAADHYENAEDARVAYEVQAKGLKSAVEATAQVMFAREKVLGKVSAQLLAVQKRIVEGRSQDREQDLQKLEGLERRYHQHVALVRQAFHAREMAWKAAAEAGLVDEANHPSLKTQEFKSMSGRQRKTFKLFARFDAMNEAWRDSAVEELAAWGNMSYAEAAAKIDGYSQYAADSRAAGEEPMDEDAYVVSLFQDSEAGERLVAAVDLETSGLHPTNAEIIEIGIVVKNSKGEIVEIIDERFDLEDPVVRDTLGVGPTDVHKISPEDVVGKRRFSDPEVQDRLGRILNDRNVVVLAHSATFERTHLNHYLKGFQQVRERHSSANLRTGADPGPVTDTRQLSSFFLHTVPKNTLDHFARANGVPYEEAHSALPDAMMSLVAFERFRESVKTAPRGQRPELKLPPE